MKILILFFKLIYYCILSFICLTLILLYMGYLKINPIKLNINIIIIYFIINAILWPFIKVFNRDWFKLKEHKLITYKEKALNMHQMDKNNNSKNSNWSIKGMSYNPWSYNNNNTATYSNASGCGYNVFTYVSLNIFFILLSPIFLLWKTIRK